MRITTLLLRYIAYLPANIGLVGCAYVLSPFLAAWSMKHGPVLPGRWRWFSTLNADLDGYIPQRVSGFDPAAKGFKLWWQRTRGATPATAQSKALGMPADGTRIIEQRITDDPKQQWT
ncbi:DUF7338 family protein [Rhizobium hidalgonense]|uniref:DUF7338 family protein n=1 Tax=Rhizobium hidalgonense TaxID=1538159 RepID=UPI0028726D32|nr:hypothetical protein [Rhizobium hidalgonense]MDR9813198.1 hypothetical protein [Rhizobium hidalgonense]